MTGAAAPHWEKHHFFLSSVSTSLATALSVSKTPVPFTAMAGDLKGNVPMFSWITPDMCHDQHDCSVSVGDDWLRQTVGMITQSKAWTANGLLFIVWDEDDGSTQNRVLSLVISPNQSHKVTTQAYTHYSLLATIEDTLGVGRLGQAVGARAMQDLLGH